MELQALDATLTEVRAKLLPTEEKLRGTVLELEHAENRAVSAEAAARDVAEKLILAEKDAREALNRAAAAEAEAREKVVMAETRAQEAEIRAREAEIRAQEAVKGYKNSPAFASDLYEGAMDAFAQGFEACKGRLSRHFNLENLERFKAEDVGETSDTEVGDATSEAATVGDPRAEAPPAKETTSSPTSRGGCLEGQ